MTTAYCSALVVGAPSSGSGKTTVVAALARALTQQGKKVRVFKTGPDFIDPQFLSIAAQSPAYQLDLWMCGEAHCQHLLYQAAQEADMILIEGVMGMFDGQCSSADIAAKFNLQILAVVDAGAMAPNISTSSR
ncbi:nucleotide-binding protein [Vibrio sp. M260118]|uniref:nucleotide-binding protein n=1 Tax=Vibrio sp. M260118 TaxID=3020896 RepID=UPI002F41CF53